MVILIVDQERFRQLREAYPGSQLLIVSNTAGSSSDNTEGEKRVTNNTGVEVLRHSVKASLNACHACMQLNLLQKPGCASEILAYFRSHPETKVISPSQIAVVGDRLFTDVMMANMMGSHSIWVKDGVVYDRGLVSTTCNALFCWD